MKMAVFWVVAPCSLVEVYQRFRGPCCLHHQGDAIYIENNLGTIRFLHMDITFTDTKRRIVFRYSRHERTEIIFIKNKIKQEPEDESYSSVMKRENFHAFTALSLNTKVSDPRELMPLAPFAKVKG
jgi:hypothetical protein